jgi:hypothetical protein
LPPHRVRLAEGLVEAIEVRYDAGKFGAGYKNQPKSPTSVRAVPLPRQVRVAIEEGLDGCPAMDGSSPVLAATATPVEANGPPCR